MISKKIAFIIGFIVFIVAGGASYVYFSRSTVGSKAPEVAYKSPVANDAGGVDLSSGPKTEECPMNGKLMTKAQRDVWEKHRPMGVMIENHTEARPQSGISTADIVYEAVAEGGITRFLNIFYCADAKTIGPVRSARMYFLRILEEYGANPLYVHVGGANTPGPANALGEINNLGWDGYNDMNQFAVPFPYYYRDYERLPNRATEHTMYAATAKLWDYANKTRKLTEVDEKGKRWDTNFVKWKFRDDAPAASRGTTNKISLTFWSQFQGDYGVVWTYHKDTNSYTRENGGKPHLDKNTGKPLEAKNIFVIFAKESPANDGYEGGHLLYAVIGGGDGIFFQDGNVVKGTWTKKDEKTRMKFFDATGKELSIVRGQVFVEIQPTGNKVTY